MQGIARLQAAAELMAGILQKRANAALDTTVSQNAAQNTKATAVNAAINNPHTGKLVSNPPRYDVDNISENQQTMNTAGLYPEQQPVQQKMAGMPANKFIHPTWWNRGNRKFDPELKTGFHTLQMPVRWGQGNWKFDPESLKTGGISRDILFNKPFGAGGKPFSNRWGQGNWKFDPAQVKTGL